MSSMEDDRPKKPGTPHPGEILADLSVDELKSRIALYQSEIERIGREIDAKEASRKSADSFFRL